MGILYSTLTTHTHTKSLLSSKNKHIFVMESGCLFDKHVSTRKILVKDVSSSSSSRSMLLADLFVREQQQNGLDTTLKSFLKFLSSKKISLDERLRCQECWQP